MGARPRVTEPEHVGIAHHAGTPRAGGDERSSDEERLAIGQTVRASLLLGASSGVAILVALVQNKVAAYIVGPVGLGYFALLQNLVALTVLIAGLGLGTIVVRVGAQPVAGGSATQVEAVRRASWRLTAAGAATAAVALIAARDPIAAGLLGDSGRRNAVVLMAAGVAFSLATTLELGLFNVTRRVRALALSNPASSVAGGAGAVAALTVWGERGIPAAALAYLGLTWAATAAFDLGRPRGPRPTAAEVRVAIRELLGAGVPYTASMIAGSGIQLLLPSLVLRELGPASVGYQRAAATISTAYLGILLTAMARVYFPQLAAVPAGDTRALARVVNRQQTLVMLVGAPLILACLAAAPIVVPLVYAPSFAPAVAVLQWQLVGELFKFSSWTLAFAVLARAPGHVYLVTETVAGVVMLAATYLGARMLGVVGLGVAYAATYAIYLAVTYVAVRRSLGPLWRRSHLIPLAAAVGTAVTSLLLPSFGFARAQVPVSIAGAVAAAAVSGIRLRAMLRS